MTEKKGGEEWEKIKEKKKTQYLVINLTNKQNVDEHKFNGKKTKTK